MDTGTRALCGGGTLAVDLGHRNFGRGEGPVRAGQLRGRGVAIMASAAVEGQLRAAGHLRDLDWPLLHAARHSSVAAAVESAEVEGSEDSAGGRGDAAHDGARDGANVRLPGLVSGVSVAASVGPDLAITVGASRADARAQKAAQLPSILSFDRHRQTKYLR